MPIACRLALAAACTVLACAASPSATTPAPRGASVRTLDGRTITHAEIEHTMDRLMAAAHVPGVAIAIVNGGRVAYLGARGWRDVAAQQPLTVDTAIPGASFTKAAFAIMVMRLVEDGRLDLDRPIEQYLGKPIAELEDYGDLASDARHHQIWIYAPHQFPIASSEISHVNDAIRLSYGLGWGVFFTPYGKAYFKRATTTVSGATAYRSTRRRPRSSS